MIDLLGQDFHLRIVAGLLADHRHDLGIGHAELPHHGGQEIARAGRPGRAVRPRRFQPDDGVEGIFGDGALGGDRAQGQIEMLHFLVLEKLVVGLARQDVVAVKVVAQRHDILLRIGQRVVVEGHVDRAGLVDQPGVIDIVVGARAGRRAGQLQTRAGLALDPVVVVRVAITCHELVPAAGLVGPGQGAARIDIPEMALHLARIQGQGIQLAQLLRRAEAADVGAEPAEILAGLVVLVRLELQLLQQPLGLKLVLGVQERSKNKSLVHADRRHLLGEHHQRGQNLGREKSIHQPGTVFLERIGDEAHDLPLIEGGIIPDAGRRQARILSGTYDTKRGNGTDRPYGSLRLARSAERKKRRRQARAEKKDKRGPRGKTGRQEQR